MNSFEKKLEQYIRKQNMIPRGCTIVAAVSGGADSLAMLLALDTLCDGGREFLLHVLHVEHGIRGEESRKDAKFTQRICAERKLPCRVVSVDVPHYAKEHGLGLEEAARILRYQALREYAASLQGEVRIALAHHMEDNAETVLMSLLRGSGPKGLGGMRPLRQDADGMIYIRPLLGMRRAEMEAYLSERGMTWCCDETNQDEAYTRNLLRKRLIPELAKVNPQAIRHMNQSAALSAEMWDYVQEQAKAAFDRIAVESGPELSLPVQALKELPTALQKVVVMLTLTKLAGRSKDLELIHVEEILELADGQSGKWTPLPYGLVCRKDFDHLLFAKAMDSNNKAQIWVSPEMLEEGPISLMIPGGMLTIKCMDYTGNFEEIPQKQYTKWFDYANMKNGFMLRYRQEGDYLIIDEAGHRKKLTRCMIDDRIPGSQRDKQLLVAQGQEVLWLVGGRSSYRTRVSDRTEKILELHYLKGDYHGLQQKL